MRINGTVIQKIHTGLSLPSVRGGRLYEFMVCHGPSGKVAAGKMHAR